MKVYKVNDAAVKAAAPESYDGTKSSWLKIGVGEHRLRICPPYDEKGVFYNVRVRHKRMEDDAGLNYFPHCFDHLFDTKQAAFAKYVMDIGRLTKDDFAAWKKYGCPICSVRKKLLSLDATANVDKLKTDRQGIFNVIDRADGQLYIYSSGITILKSILAQYNAYPDLVDVDKGLDFVLNATGQLLQRRYQGPNFIPSPTPLGLAEGVELNNLDAAVASGVQPYDLVVELVKRNLKDQVGLIGAR
jgi:hypothetical protein